MDSMGTVAAIDEIHHVTRDLLRTGRMLRQGHPGAVPAGLLSVLAAINAMATRAGNRCHGKDLATHCGLDPSTVSRSVGTLVALDLVRREADPVDGRASLLALTPQGRQALEDTDRWYNMVVAEVLADWTREEVEALAATLRRFTADADRCARAGLRFPAQRRSLPKIPTESISDYPPEAAR
jgi:DNA-binding MarR family transcriptional regulator